MLIRNSGLEMTPPYFPSILLAAPSIPSLFFATYVPPYAVLWTSKECSSSSMRLFLVPASAEHVIHLKITSASVIVVRFLSMLGI
jgi:hypothetical protein